MIMLKINGMSVCTSEDLSGLTPLEQARKLYAVLTSSDKHYDEYILIDEFCGYRNPLTKKGVPSKVRKLVRERIELGRFSWTELEVF